MFRSLTYTQVYVDSTRRQPVGGRSLSHQPAGQYSALTQLRSDAMTFRSQMDASETGSQYGSSEMSQNQVTRSFDQVSLSDGAHSDRESIFESGVF